VPPVDCLSEGVPRHGAEDDTSLKCY
jgi:hypothetical protein